MVAEFNTKPAASTKGSGSTILIVLGIAVAGYFAYRYFIKKQDDDKPKQ